MCNTTNNNNDNNNKKTLFHEGTIQNQRVYWTWKV